MMKLFKLGCFLSVLWFTQTNSWAQEDTLKVSYTPYELLSSYYEHDFEPFKKRNIYAGLRFNLSDRQEENTDYLIQNVIDGSRNDFNLTFKGGYYTGDYAMVGISLDLYQNKFIGNIYKEPDTLASNLITKGFAITPNFRSTVPLTQNGRLSFFTELGVTFGSSSSLVRRTSNIDVVNKQYSKDFDFKIGLSPGVTFFVMEAFAFEAQLDVFGYALNVSKKSVNSGEPSRKVNQTVDFNINLLSMNIGLAYYLGAKNEKR